jgi:electron transport complex protein RnfG
MNAHFHNILRALSFILIAAVTGQILSAADAISRDEALAAAFPGAEIRRKMLFLTEAQQKEAAELSGVDIPTPMIASYIASKDGQVLGRAYVDTHFVRTERESLLIILNIDGTLRRIEITAFLEHPEHQVPPSWYRQYDGRSLGDDLQIDRAIRPIAGATLTAHATNAAVRRILAIDKVLSGNP